MYRSEDRILTTHVGSLPRPQEITQLMYGHQEGAVFDEDGWTKIGDAVVEIVGAQRQTGIDVIDDGEVSKAGFVNYVADRVEGIGGEAEPWSLNDLLEVPDVAERQFMSEAAQHIHLPACIGELRYVGQADVARDIANLKRGMAKHDAQMAFMTAPSPGCLTWHMTNRHYGSYEDYVMAMADVMKEEYEAIAAAGFMLQLDCPDIPLGNPATCKWWGDDVVERLGYRGFVELHLAALDRATANIPGEQLRLHVCWSNYEGPHRYDIPLAEVLGPVLNARPKTVVFEAANPRHEHEWTTLRSIKIPEDHVIVPGVINTVTNFVEHPELVAQRIERYASVVDREQIIAGTDCGFGTYAGFGDVTPHAAWLKLASLVEGAAIASKRLWSLPTA